MDESSSSTKGPRNTTFERETTADNGGTAFAGNNVEIHNSTLYLDTVAHNCSDACRPLVPVFDVPEVRNNRFVGREDVFEKLQHLLDGNRENCSLGRVALIGLGGMGKTQIALEYCYRNYPTKYQYVFWIMANSEESLNFSFLKVATLLKLSTQGIENPTVYISLVKQWFNDARKRWLMVFDNADESVYRLILHSYPTVGDGDILLTSRDAVAEHKTSVISLDEVRMDIESALKLLFRKNIPENDSVGRLIIEELGHLPLAIHLAAACMEEDGLTPVEFLTNFKDSPKEYLNMEELTKVTGNSYVHTVWTAWDMCITRVKDQNPFAANLLNAFAFLHPDNIPLQLFRAQPEHIFLPDSAKPPPRSLEKAINLLCSSSLVRRIAATTTELSNSDVYREKVSIHRLVQTIVGLEIDNAEKPEWCKRLIAALSREVPSNFKHGDYEHFRRVMEIYMPHIQQVILNFKLWDPEKRGISNELPSLLSPTVLYLTRQALFEDAKDFALLAVSSSEIANGPEHRDTATALSNLSYFYTSQQMFEDAEPYGRRTLEIRKKALGLRHEDTMTSLRDLIHIYHKLGKEENLELLYLENNITPLHHAVHQNDVSSIRDRSTFRAPLEDKISLNSPMMKVYGVFIVHFIQMIYDRILVKNRKRWGSFVVLDLRFPNSDPEKQVAVTAWCPADSKNRKELLKRLKSVKRRDCDRLNWATFWDFVEERFNKTEEDFGRFKSELLTLINRGRVSVDYIITKANPSVYWPSKDPDMRLIRFQLQFHDFE